MATRDRRTVRLATHDYAATATYFITLVTVARLCLFGEVVDEKSVLNDLGLIVEAEWRRAAGIRPEVALDTFTVMPNHMHALLRVKGPSPSRTAANGLSRRPRTLGALVAGFKSVTSSRVSRLIELQPPSVWQRGYHERVVRDDAELQRIRLYIERNPATWPEDPENPVNVPIGPIARSRHAEMP